LIQSYQTNRNNRLVTLEVKIKQLEKTLSKLEKRCDHVAEKGCPQQAKRLRNTLRQKEEKLLRWQQKGVLGIFPP
jgi:superfamily II RNA helicase